MKRDYTGERYGRLVAVSDTGKNKRKQAVWVFRCDCGALVERVACKTGESARAGYSPACDACLSPRLDFTGQRFGKLVAIQEVGMRRGSVVWLFQCDCGRHIEKIGNIVAKRTQAGFEPSCGSYACNGYAKTSDAFLKALIRHYTAGAETRGLEFSLTLDECAQLFSGNCCYCGQGPSKAFRLHRKYGKPREPLMYNGIDRVNNDIGYITGNVVSCCITCNRAKHTMTYEQWISWLDRLTAFRTRG